ncbi:hypothetical protein PoB_003388800 [Plakobranchus ocellatus]|uniref:Uncharacterized protein n=1 Tax=Plakobranchus ocellatus TaxID=259542 RepID=A0AAV4AKR6_9GAST|nr:hypothetical protein PoB_003388800 [Plakobranchus ocellatus]
MTDSDVARQQGNRRNCVVSCSCESWRFVGRTVAHMVTWLISIKRSEARIPDGAKTIFHCSPVTTKHFMASPQQDDLRLLGPPSGRGADGGARTRDGRVPADLRTDSQATVPPTSRRKLWKPQDLEFHWTPCPTVCQGQTCWWDKHGSELSIAVKDALRNCQRDTQITCLQGDQGLLVMEHRP